METIIDMFARKLREGVTFVAPFGIAFIYVGMHKEDDAGYVVLMDHEKYQWTLLEEPAHDEFVLAASIMSMIDRGVVFDFVPSDDLTMDRIIPSLLLAR